MLIQEPQKAKRMLNETSPELLASIIGVDGELLVDSLIGERDVPEVSGIFSFAHDFVQLWEDKKAHAQVFTFMGDPAQAGQFARKLLENYCEQVQIRLRRPLFGQGTGQKNERDNIYYNGFTLTDPDQLEADLEVLDSYIKYGYSKDGVQSFWQGGKAISAPKYEPGQEVILIDFYCWM